MSADKIIEDLLDEELNVGGAAVITRAGGLVFQTENWDLRDEIPTILETLENGGSSIVLLGIKYMIVENTPERIIGTNITGQGHLIFAPFENGVLVTYIMPQVGPRDALFNVQNTAQKLNLII